MTTDKSTPSKSGQPLPSIPEGFSLPFYYSSLCNCGVFYKVSMDSVAAYLEDTGLKPANFEGSAMVSYNYQLYTGQFSFGASTTQEVELSILAYPESQEDLIPQITFNQYIRGEDQTKLFGNQRVFVPCDNKISISAGEELYGEPKFFTSFKVKLPSLNSNPVGTKWEVTVLDPKDRNEFIYKCTVDTGNLISFPGNYSPITEYGRHQGKLVACRWNILQPMDTFFLDEDQNRVLLEYGNSDHPMKSTMSDLIGDSKPSAVRTFLSHPVAMNSRAYYPSEI